MDLLLALGAIIVLLGGVFLAASLISFIIVALLGLILPKGGADNIWDPYEVYKDDKKKK